MKSISDIYPAIEQTLQKYYYYHTCLGTKSAMERDVVIVLQKAVKCGLLDATLWEEDHKVSITEIDIDRIHVELPSWIIAIITDKNENPYG